jgi:hypothetical protein
VARFCPDEGGFEQTLRPNFVKYVLSGVWGDFSAIIARIEFHD